MEMDSTIPEEPTDPAAVGTAVCNACKQDLDEVRDESVVSFGKYLFHVNCRCAKCRCLVEHNTNLLLLSDGSPVCENCSYMCTICQKPIHNEAIVTGDESYHADCFRCRSCSNKIEELIFAKTNQGIWCMTCHNDRVARTRRHADAKRRARKDRESRGGRQSRETAPPQSNAYDSSSVSRDTSSPPTPVRTPEPVQATSRHSPAPVRPLPPHPGDSSSMPSEYRSDAVTASSGSVTIPARSGMPSLPPSIPSPSLLSQAGAPAPQPAATGIRTDAAPVSVTSAAAAQLPHLSVTADVFVDTIDDTDAAGRALGGSSTLGLAAPTAGSKAHNRRSGFYGAMARPVPPPAGSNDAEGDVDFDVPSTRQTASPRRPSRDILTPQKATPVEAQQSQPYGTADLAHSTSFYDPDTLLFLTHVTSSSPGSPFPSGATSATTGDPAAGPVSDKEHLDTLDSPRDPTTPDERADTTSSSKPSEAAQRVRESLQMSQQESVRSSLAELDVELIETLLAELDATQREIKEIKTRYNAFRRASRSAFEGFSMAREEYDKEVAARREVERQMASLRARFAEQARRLAQVDQEQATTEELKRRSKTLRTSVVGMEKHLSQLRAELALSTAQAAELVALDGSRGPQGGSPDGQPLGPSSQAEMAEGLNQRLEAVKESHRAEIGTLVADRDDLLREIEELKRVRDAHAAEAELLASRNVELNRLNETAARNLDDLRGPLSKISMSSDRLGEGRGHVSTMSASSAATLFSPPPTRPTGAPARPGAVTIAEAQPAYRPTTAETASRNKFWSKNKSKNDPSKQSTSQAGVASPPPDKSPGPSIRGAAAAEPSNRSHLFQPSSILRPVRCDYCGDKMWGLNEVRCSACGSYAHAKCAGFLQTSCSPGGVSPTVAQPAEDYGPPLLASGSIFGAELAVQAEKEGGNVPAVVLKCIEAVEEGGMTYEGIYRKTGGMGQTKLITQNFERGQDFDLSDRDKFNDIAAVTSCLKNYFRSLPVPLMTHDLHEDFISATEISDPKGRLDAIELVLQRLPRTHYETARHLFLHLNRVQARAAENKMTAANLGVVFGPTVLRSPVAAREWSDMGPKTKLVEILCEHAERLFSPARAQV